MTSIAAASYHAQMLRLGRLFGAAAAIMLGTPPTWAGEPDDAEKARLATHLRAGAAAATAKQWTACIEAHSAAAAIDDAPTTAGELGLCEENVGRFADAYGHLRRAVDAKVAQWKRYKTAQIRVRKHLVILFVSASPTQAVVLLDGRPIGRADGRHLAIEPGTHTVSARLEGYEDAIEPPRTWAAGDLPHVHLELKPKPVPAPSERTVMTKPPAPAMPEVSPERERPTAPWYMPAPTPRGVLVPLAAVGGATALVSGLTSLALEADRAALRSKLSVSACGPDVISRPSVCDALAERYEQRNIALGVAIGGTVAGGLLAGAARIAFGLERRAATPTVAPTAYSSGGGFVLFGAW